MDKVIQIANICKDMCNVPNPIPGRIYYAKGCAPALNTCGGGVEKTYVFMDKIKMKFIYKLPHGYFPGGAYFKYAPTVNSSAWSANNLLVWITPKDISSGSPTTARAISQTTTLSRCGRALSQDAPETD